MNDVLKRADVFVLLASDIEKDINGTWHTSQYDHSGITYGEWRVEAIIELMQKFPSKPLVISGGFSPQRIETCPSIAEVVMEELARRGLSKELMIKEESSFNTYSQIKNVIALCKNMHFHRVIFVTSIWAIERAALLYENLESKGEKVTFLSAETILGDLNPEKWNSSIDSAIKNDQLKERIEKEQKGISDLINGRYKFK